MRWVGKRERWGERETNMQKKTEIETVIKSGKKKFYKSRKIMVVYL